MSLQFAFQFLPYNCTVCLGESQAKIDVVGQRRLWVDQLESSDNIIRLCCICYSKLSNMAFLPSYLDKREKITRKEYSQRYSDKN